MVCGGHHGTSSVVTSAAQCEMFSLPNQVQSRKKEFDNQGMMEDVRERIMIERKVERSRLCVLQLALARSQRGL